MKYLIGNAIQRVGLIKKTPQTSPSQQKVTLRDKGRHFVILALNNRAHLCLYYLDMSVLGTMIQQPTGRHIVHWRHTILIQTKLVLF